MRFPASLLLFLTLTAAAVGGVEIAGPDRAPPYTLARLALEGLPDGDSATWAVFPFDQADGVESEGGGASRLPDRREPTACWSRTSRRGDSVRPAPAW